ncbi:hypothetical protein [Streptomyces sp. NPDC050738]|uniref:hypothetical protein n=1 Tax=Streptomyces sp. NPDC050738 TaxID=3154744 RepID=UPI0034276E17
MVDGEGSGRASRPRIWAGAIALAMGCYVVGDTVHRARTVLDLAARWWPWALLALSLLNLLRSAVPPGSLIAPLLLAAVGLTGLAVSGGIDRDTMINLIAPGVLALSGASLLFTLRPFGRTDRWSRFLATGRVVVPPGSGPLLSVRAVLGELRTDLTAADSDSSVAVHVTAVAGHVRIAVPQSSPVRIHTTGALLTRVTGPGPQTGEHPAGSGGFTIHVLGVCGAVAVVRA